MVRCTAYSTRVKTLHSARPHALDSRYAEIVAACKAQNITHIGILASVTGKLLAEPEQFRVYRDKLAADGITCWAEVFAVGHPAMGSYYHEDGTPPDPALHWEGDLIVQENDNINLLPQDWSYAVNEFGNPIYCTAQLDDAWRAQNERVVRELARVFDEIWFDDEYRLDGDQGAGQPHTSTAADYSDAALLELSRAVGRRVNREEVLADQSLHDLWMDQKCARLARMWQAMCDTAREVNPNVKMGLMIRWFGEERDGLDVDQLVPAMQDPPLLRAGEGHFTQREYLLPESQVIEYLSASYHVSWYPQNTETWTETTYFDGVPREWVLKKVALGLAAGCSAVAYCPCVRDWVMHQNYLEGDVATIDGWAQAMAHADRQVDPIVILRTKSAGRGDKQPTQRVRDRQAFPLFSMAGLYSICVRQGGWRDDGAGSVLAVTGRSVWDVDLASVKGRHLVLDGAALLENSPLNEALGISDVAAGGGGLVTFACEKVQPVGMLWTSKDLTIIPYVWQDVPAAFLDSLLRDIRGVLGKVVRSAVLEGHPLVVPVQVRHAERDALMLVNLTQEDRTVTVRLKGPRQRLTDLAGNPVPARQVLWPDEVRVLYAVE
jgi:hypothetical protein